MSDQLGLAAGRKGGSVGSHPCCKSIICANYYTPMRNSLHLSHFKPILTHHIFTSSFEPLKVWTVIQITDHEDNGPESSGIGM